MLTVSGRDARVPLAERCVIRPLLEQHAAETPDATYVIAPDGTPGTFAPSARAWSAPRLAASLQPIPIDRASRGATDT